MRVPDKQESFNWLLMPSAVEDSNNAQNQLATTSAEFQIAERALTAAFDQLKQYSSSFANA